MAKKQEKHSFKVFSENIKAEKINKVMLMYGTEQFLVKWAVDSLVKKYVNPATMSMDFIKIDENITCSEIIEACETFSMFSPYKVVWVKNIKLLNTDLPKGYTKEDVEMLIEYVKNSNESTILIFSGEEIKLTTSLSSTLKKCADVYDFNRLDKPSFSSFARKRFQAANINITNSALNELIDSTGYFNMNSDYTLFHFENDIEKIIAHCDTDTVSIEDIERTVSGDMDTFVFDMINGITGNHKDRAFSVLHNMLNSGEDAFQIIGAIVSQFEYMLAVKQLREDGYDLNAMHKKLGGSEYRLKKVIPYVNRFNVDKLKKTLSSIYEVDRNIKMGLLDSHTALELFIAGI